MNDLIKARRQKLEALKKLGINPYPSRVSFALAPIAEVGKNFKKHLRSGKAVGIAGRIMARREHGGAAFVDIFDGSAKLQVFLAKDKLGEKSFKLFSETIDIGDFIALQGKAFYTKKKEPTLEVSKWEIITKALRPLPEKWHGLQDVEERFRKRYLDILMNPKTKEIFLKKTKIVQAARSFFEQNGYIEVDTPILQPTYGGGLARPFKTHHNALNMSLYLRISDELYLKRLVVGGFRKIFEVSADFRNEGIDHFHNPEFTLLEAMTSYQDYNFAMGLIEDFYQFIVKKINKDLKVKYGEEIINFKKPWKKFKMKEIVMAKTGFDFDNIKDLAVAKDKARQLGISDDKIIRQQTTGELMNLIFEEKVQSQLVQPTIIYDYPCEISPLAKKSKDPRFVERFEHFILGQEHGNHYSELNDPIDLNERFVQEAKKKAAGFEEAHQTDKDFLEAIEYGMPPVTGIGISIERLVMLLTNVNNIREVILFPTLRPKE
ncbi:MAG: lysine--tRNA ligase [bacterium]|nr:lysine--tRNA ligase [bacterium]